MGRSSMRHRIMSTVATLALTAGMVGASASAAGAVGTLDQSQESVTVNSLWGCGGDAPTIAQTFTAGITGTLDQVELNVGTENRSDITVEIYTTASGVPDSPVPGSSSGVVAAGTGWQGATVTADVVAGTTYAMVFSCAGSALLLGGTDSAYAGGGEIIKLNGTWTIVHSRFDYAFRTYVSPANTAPAVAVATGGTCANTAGTMHLAVTDADGDDVTLSAVSSNTALVPDANIVFGGSGGNRTITFGTIKPTPGSATVTVTASDGTDESQLEIGVRTGTAGSDVVSGTDGPDLLLGRGGNDTLAGAGGNDLVCGNAGADTASGDAGDDTMVGAAGRDGLSGGAGTDALLGGADADTLTGGTEGDAFKGGPATDTATDFNAGDGDTKAKVERF